MSFNQQRIFINIVMDRVYVINLDEYPNIGTLLLFIDKTMNRNISIVLVSKILQRNYKIHR